MQLNFRVALEYIEKLSKILVPSSKILFSKRR